MLGSLNRDYVCRVPTIPAPGQTLLGGELAIGSGGKGGNQAAASALLGAPTAFVGCIGDDADGDALVADLQRAGVDTTSIARLGDVPTGVAFVLVADDGENAIVVAPGANAALDAQRVRRMLPERLGAGDVLILQAETPSDGTVEAVRIAEQVGARVVLNLAPYRATTSEVLAVADPLIVNEGEARALLGREGAELDEHALQTGISTVARSAVVTLGGRGALAVADGRSVAVRAPEVEVVDTTGAGDAFTGATAAALAVIGYDVGAAMRAGVVVAAIAVGGRGAQASYPTRQDLSESALADRYGLTHLLHVLEQAAHEHA